MIFWGWVALLLLLALLWVGYALLRIAPDATNYQESRVARNVALYRTRLAASEGDLAEEMVTPEEHAALANAAACAACHGPDGKGNQALGAPNLTDKIWLHGWGEDVIMGLVTSGKTNVMPAQAQRLSVEQIHVLGAYVWSLSQSPALASK